MWIYRDEYQWTKRHHFEFNFSWFLARESDEARREIEEVSSVRKSERYRETSDQGVLFCNANYGELISCLCERLENGLHAAQALHIHTCTNINSLRERERERERKRERENTRVRHVHDYATGRSSFRKVVCKYTRSTRIYVAACACSRRRLVG